MFEPVSVDAARPEMALAAGGGGWRRGEARGDVMTAGVTAQTKQTKEKEMKRR